MPTESIIILTIVSTLVIISITTGIIYAIRVNKILLNVMIQLNKNTEVIKEITGIDPSFIDEHGKLNN
jgi:hypothetical protein